jgi:hypothetical protein
LSKKHISPSPRNNIPNQVNIFSSEKDDIGYPKLLLKENKLVELKSLTLLKKCPF